MHTVEAFLAASDATGDPRWRDRALRITERVLGEAPRWGWRLPEHYDAAWNPIPGYNRNRPADPFRPYGATVGHGLEWSRLAINLEASFAALPATAPAWLADGAARLLDRAVTDGWAVDGTDGFVYTTDWDGSPVVHHRMHWVVAEATTAAATLAMRTGEERYADAYRLWWGLIRAVFLDPVHGSWHHELDRTLRPSSTVWEGKPDIYHALQATLIPRLPVAASIARALHRGLLDGNAVEPPMTRPSLP
jgi:sulfoquinovose isomerase